MLIQITTFFLLFLLFPQLSFAKNIKKTLRADAPHIEFEKPTQDLGSLMRGEKRSVSFSFVNAGNGDLVIQGIQAPCGCTTVSLDTSRRYKSGEAGVIEVIFDTSDFSGKISKFVTVITNEKQLPDRTLTLGANVAVDFVVNPPLIDFGDISVGQEVKKELKITVNPGVNFSIESLRFNKEFYEASFVKENQNWRVLFNLKQNAPIGFFDQTLYIKNSSKNLPEIKVPVRAMIRGPISIDDKYLEFGSVAKNEKVTRSVTFKSASKIKFSKTEILINGEKPTAEGNLLDLKLNSEKDGKIIFAATMHNQDRFHGTVHGKIYFESEEARQKSLTIDFFALFP